MNRPIVKQLSNALIRSAFVLLAAYGLRLADQAGLLGDEGARRSLQIVIGLALAVYANGMPKQMGSTPRSLKAQGYAQTALRVGGWAMTLAGLVWAGLWAFAPLSFADPVSKAVLIVATLITLGYALWVVMACRSDDRHQQTQP